MLRFNRVAVVGLSVLALSGVSASAAGAAPSYPMVKKTYGSRYCELAVAKVEGSTIRAIVYNTFGLSSCPAAAWAAATTTSALNEAKTSRGAAAVVVNGPRWWAFDEIGGVLGSTVETFGTLGMRQAAILEFTLAGLPPAFTEFQVQRTSTWVYNKGTYIRELISPTNHHYVMQSWTTQVSSKVSKSTLNTLASGKTPLVKVPVGWKFKARKLTTKLVIIAPGTMQLVQDNMKNVYSKIS